MIDGLARSHAHVCDNHHGDCLRPCVRSQHWTEHHLASGQPGVSLMASNAVIDRCQCHANAMPCQCNDHLALPSISWES